MNAVPSILIMFDWPKQSATAKASFEDLTDEQWLAGHGHGKTGQEGDEGPVGTSESGTGDLATKHGQLVAKNQDLCALGCGVQRWTRTASKARRMRR
jgi:hypothetical protein